MTLQLQPRLQKFRDIDLDFDKHPISKDVTTLTNDDAIIRSIRNLVFLNFNEKPFHPEIGCGVRQLLFENFTPLTKILIERTITEAIRNFEPRAKVENVLATVNDDLNGFDVQITFSFLNSKLPKTISLFLERIR